MYQLEIDAAPAYELVTSFTLFLNPNKGKHIQLGTKWAQNVIGELEDDFLNELHEFRGNFCMDFLSLLIFLCPKEKRDAEGFLEWLTSIPSDKLNEVVSKYLTKHEIEDLETSRDTYVRLLSKWDEQYFKRAMSEHPMMQKIRDELDAAESVLPSVNVRSFIEEKSGGISIDVVTEFDRVVLVPSYHVRPVWLYSKYRSLLIIVYSVQPDSVRRGYPSFPLLQLTKSLADESRLRILFVLMDGPKRFIDIVQEMGLSKSVVHAHLVSLRIARLIRVHVSLESTERYSLRDDVLEIITSQFQAFLGSRS